MYGCLPNHELVAAGTETRCAVAGLRPTLKDWETHLTTIFPEVRLKRYMEMRGGDGGPLSMIVALPALWVGLLYDQCAPQLILPRLHSGMINAPQAVHGDVRRRWRAPVHGRRAACSLALACSTTSAPPQLFFSILHSGITMPPHHDLHPAHALGWHALQPVRPSSCSCHQTHCWQGHVSRWLPAHCR